MCASACRKARLPRRGGGPALPRRPGSGGGKAPLWPKPGARAPVPSAVMPAHARPVLRACLQMTHRQPSLRRQDQLAISWACCSSLQAGAPLATVKVSGPHRLQVQSSAKDITCLQAIVDQAGFKGTLRITRSCDTHLCVWPLERPMADKPPGRRKPAPCRRRIADSAADAAGPCGSTAVPQIDRISRGCGGKARQGETCHQAQQQGDGEVASRGRKSNSIYHTTPSRRGAGRPWAGRCPSR